MGHLGYHVPRHFAVPNEMNANLPGTEAMVRERLQVYRTAGIITLRVEPAGETLDGRLITLGRLMDLVKAMP